MSDQAFLDIAKWQVIGEKSAWTLLDQKLAGTPEPGEVLNPRRPKFLFEWQKEIDSNPSFAASALLPVFMRPDPDWSFLKKQTDWDENYDAYVYVFLFERKNIEGREPDFVAASLKDVVKKQLQMAVAKAPTKLYFDVRVQSNYDPGQAKIRFLDPNSRQPIDTLELLRRTELVQYVPAVKNLPAPKDRDMHNMLPEAARSAAIYNWSQAFDDVPVARPSAGVYGWDPEQTWRKSICGNTQDFHTASLGAFALDRQLKLSAVPFDIGRAEKMVVSLRNLKVRVHVAIDRVDKMQTEYGGQIRNPQALLFAKVTKVEILAPHDETLARQEKFDQPYDPILTIPVSSLPAPVK
jgi:hypothetical protein